jgi:hypothetical protein
VHVFLQGRTLLGMPQSSLVSRYKLLPETKSQIIHDLAKKTHAGAVNTFSDQYTSGHTDEYHTYDLLNKHQFSHQVGICAALNCRYNQTNSNK